MEQQDGRMAFVTGANGFIGSHLVDELLQQGWRVRVLVRETSDLTWLPLDRIELIRGSLRDGACLTRCVDGVAAVFHVAGAYRAPSLEAYRQVNVEPTRMILEALVQRAEAAGQARADAHFVFVSSFAAAGPSRDGKPMTEEAPRRPVSDYGRSKAEAEEVTLSFADRVPVTVVRPPGVYGPRDRNFLVVFRQASKGIVPRIGRADRMASLIFARDFAQGLILAATRASTEGQVYFMANETLTSNVDLVNDIADVLGVRVRRVLVPMFVFDVLAWITRWQKRLTGKVGFLNEDRIATMRQRFWVASVEKMKRDLEWSPPTPLREGLETTAKWYREQGWI